MAKISAVLSTRSVVAASDGASISYLHGAIEPDQDPSQFRLYSSPSNKRSFFLMRTNDVVGEVYEWTPDEVAHHGFAGHKMYTLPIKYGCVIQSVAIRNITIGLPISSCNCDSTHKTKEQTKVHSLGGCNYDSNCASLYPDAPCNDNGVCDTCCVA
jgi:hypothetical protein